MAISESKIRTMISMPKELKSELEKLAKGQNRSLNNFMVTVLQDYVESKKNSQNELLKAFFEQNNN